MVGIVFLSSFHWYYMYILVYNSHLTQFRTTNVVDKIQGVKLQILFSQITKNTTTFWK